MSDQQQSDTYRVATWTENPFTSVKKRRWTVEHRVLVESHSGVGVDVRHQVRSDDPGAPDDWTDINVYEARQHGIQKLGGGAEVLRS